MVQETSRGGAAAPPTLELAFAAIDQEIAHLERGVNGPAAPAPGAAVDRALALVTALLRAYAANAGKAVPATEDVLEVFKVFVKGDPSLNAVRDSIRELVYYRHCLDLGRADALPARPAVMAARVTRHVYLYLRVRGLAAERLAGR